MADLVGDHRRVDVDGRAVDLEDRRVLETVLPALGLELRYLFRADEFHEFGLHLRQGKHLEGAEERIAVSVSGLGEIFRDDRTCAEQHSRGCLEVVQPAGRLVLQELRFHRLCPVEERAELEVGPVRYDFEIDTLGPHFAAALTEIEDGTEVKVWRCGGRRRAHAVLRPSPAATARDSATCAAAPRRR